MKIAKVSILVLSITSVTPTAFSDYNSTGTRVSPFMQQQMDRMDAMKPENQAKAACGDEKKVAACTKKYYNVMNNVVHYTQAQFYIMGHWEVKHAREAVAFANSDCSCIAKGDEDKTNQISFVKTKIPKMIEEAEKSKPKNAE